MTARSKQILAYGSWPSSITASVVTTAGAKLGAMADYQGHRIATESRPDEGGRVALVQKSANGETRDLFPTTFSVRTRVHEYGGAAWWIGDAALYACHWGDQRLYRTSGPIESLTEPMAITPEPLSEHGLRFADGVESPCGAWVIAVCEMHGDDRKRFGLSVASEVDSNVESNTESSSSDEPANVIVAIPVDACAVQTPSRMRVLSQQADFVSNPRVSTDGKFLSWLQWHHPNMPWDTTELMMAQINTSDEGITLTDVRCVAGGVDESIVGPQWVEDGRLVYSSDSSGWWNLYALNTTSKTDTDVAQPLTTLDEAEIGAPAWAIGTSRFIELSVDDTQTSEDMPWLIMAVTQNANDWLAVLTRRGQLHRLPLDCAAVRGLAPSLDGGLLALVDFADIQSGYVSFTAQQIATLQPGTVLPSASLNTPLKDADTFSGSTAEALSYPSGGVISHAFFYPPTSPTHEAADGEKPPLIVMGHGGPTGHSTPALSLAVQFWTSRGFAVADVNYRGSSGFGRRYRQALNEAWGVADVEDCIAIVQFLADSGRVDPARCVIRGGSAGGLTVLRALQLSDAFAAGTSLYGVADLEGLLADTHKFESRYLDNLIGAYPQFAARYRERSPIHHASDINAPLLVLQGDEDKVVPPSQSEAIVAAVAAQALPHAYVVFEGEQHGWRKASTLVRALELELWFYGKALGFEPADTIEAPTEAVGFL